VKTLPGAFQTRISATSFPMQSMAPHSQVLTLVPVRPSPETASTRVQ
jgi:hypothetical protein